MTVKEAMDRQDVLHLEIEKIEEELGHLYDELDALDDVIYPSDEPEVVDGIEPEDLIHLLGQEGYCDSE